MFAQQMPVIPAGMGQQVDASSRGFQGHHRYAWHTAIDDRHMMLLLFSQDVKTSKRTQDEPNDKETHEVHFGTMASAICCDLFSKL
jgi:hypothetical protein